MAKHVLIVDDEPDHFAHSSEALTRLCPDWELTFAPSGAEALKHLETHPCDAVVADMNMPETTGAQLLNEIGKQYPKILRLITSDVNTKDMVMRCVLGSYDFVQKPCEPEALGHAVARALALDQLIGDEKMKRLVKRIRTFPSLPTLYFEVLKELRNSDASAERVGDIIARDLAMSTKVLQALNSSFYSLPRQITDPTEAVNILGFEMVKSLVLCIQVYTQFDKVKPYYFSIDKLWRHSTAVAQTARKIAYHEGLGNEIAEESYTAGLLHDIGKLVLVSNFADDYKRAQKLAQIGKIPLHIAEKSIFGASHGEVGAYLIGTWGMPLSLAETTCYHHIPAKAKNNFAGSLTFVHVANALVGENQDNDFLPPKIDEAYLAELNLQGHCDVWRTLVVSSKVGKLEGLPRGETESTAKHEDTSTFKAPASEKPKPPAKTVPHWVIISAVAACLVILGVIVLKHLLFH